MFLFSLIFTFHIHTQIIWKSELPRKRAWQGIKRSDLLLDFPHGHNGCDWIRPPRRARSFIQLPQGGWQVPRHLGHPLLLLSGYYQRDGWEGQWPCHKPAPIRKTGNTGGGFEQYVKMPKPHACFFVLDSIMEEIQKKMKSYEIEG